SLWDSFLSLPSQFALNQLLKPVTMDWVLVLFVCFQMTTPLFAGNICPYPLLSHNRVRSFALAKPQLLKMSREVELTQNISYVLQCNVLAGSTPIFIEWRKDGQVKLRESDNVRSDSMATLSMLTFKRLQPNHTG